MNRYQEINIDKTEEGTLYFVNPIYPDIPLSEDDIYVISTSGDRYDTLAQQFYNDPKLWWIIAASNNSNRSSLSVTPGVQIRIPADKNQAIQLYIDINKNR